MSFDCFSYFELRKSIKDFWVYYGILNIFGVSVVEESVIIKSFLGVFSLVVGFGKYFFINMEG